MTLAPSTGCPFNNTWPSTGCRPAPFRPQPDDSITRAASRQQTQPLAPSIDSSKRWPAATERGGAFPLFRLPPRRAAESLSYGANGYKQPIQAREWHELTRLPEFSKGDRKST